MGKWEKDGKKWERECQDGFYTGVKLRIGDKFTGVSNVKMKCSSRNDGWQKDLVYCIYFTEINWLGSIKFYYLDYARLNTI